MAYKVQLFGEPWQCSSSRRQAALTTMFEAVGLNFPTSQLYSSSFDQVWGFLLFFFLRFHCKHCFFGKVILFFPVDDCGCCTPRSAEMGQEFSSSECSSLGACRAECFQSWSSVPKLSRPFEEGVLLLSTALVPPFPSATARLFLPLPSVTAVSQPVHRLKSNFN